MKPLSFKTTIAKYGVNTLGISFRPQKFLIIESDDWGAVRMPSNKTYEKLCQHGAGEGCFFDKYDSLESAEDLERLAEVLTSVKDKNGNNVVFQPYVVVANPNYDKIEEDQFSSYYYESFLDTYSRAPHTEKSFSVILEGIDAGVWHPQSHGREHIQVFRWMKALSENSLVKEEFYSHAFHSGCIPKGIDYYSAFDAGSSEEVDGMKLILADSVRLFKEIYGYNPISFCPPCGYVDKNIVDFLPEVGLMLGPGSFKFLDGKGHYSSCQKFWGNNWTGGVKLYRRNCKFEPARNHNIDWADRCMAEIDIAFRCGKPACIDTHRVNFIGSLCQSNRDDSLRQFSRLLNRVVTKWPDVEFATSESIYNFMSKND